ncbi:MAG: carbon monoxide dehydrogenase [Betaproteobacteria bacterium]|nr:carbon monoxide dehydrogenase [Betaproteobacteria bacterium]
MLAPRPAAPNVHSEGIGAYVRRREDRRFIEGKGQYVADIRPVNALHCAFVRSPHAHARILALRTEAASVADGVVAVLTGADMAADSVGPLTALWRIAGVDGAKMKEPPRFALSGNIVRHVGEIVALIVAATADQAADAAELLDIDWEPLPAVVDLRSALAADAPQLHPEAPGNLCLHFIRGAREPVERAFAAAAHVVKLDLINQRLVCAALEPRSVIAVTSPTGGADCHALTLWSSTQVPHQIRKFVAEALTLPETAIRVIAPDVGGGFGTKGKLYPEEIALAWVALRLGRAVKWVSSRSEAFVSDYQGRDHVTHAQLALDAAGHFTALRVDTLASMGAYVSSVGAAVPTTVYTALLSGPYRIPAIFADVRAVFTNTVPTDAYRGAGRPEACYVLERLVEEAARQTGIDRFDLRRRNLIPVEAMPYTTPIGPVYDSGNFAKLFERALEVADYAGYEVRRQESARGGLLRGFGLCYFVESSGVGPSKMAAAFGARIGFYDSATVQVAADGSITLSCGTHNHGQGHSTSYAQLLAARIGVPISDIAIIEGDTARTPLGAGTFGSRSMVIAGTAIHLAAAKIVRKARQFAAHRLEAAEDDVEHAVVADAGIFRVAGTDRLISWKEVARGLALAHDLPPGMEPGLHETASFDPTNLTWSNGAQACEIEIDPETGVTRVLRYVAIDDVGTVINPIIVEGQVQGGAAQGVGQALLEAAVYDLQSAQPLTGSFMDYAMPRAGLLGEFLAETDEGQPCTHNPLGVKGAGESGTIGAPSAIASAVLNALEPVGVRHLDMPYSAPRIWQAIRQAHQGTAH